jgi:hypothetical protein
MAAAPARHSREMDTSVALRWPFVFRHSMMAMSCNVAHHGRQARANATPRVCRLCCCLYTGANRLSQWSQAQLRSNTEWAVRAGACGAPTYQVQLCRAAGPNVIGVLEVLQATVKNQFCLLPTCVTGKHWPEQFGIESTVHECQRRAASMYIQIGLF